MVLKKITNIIKALFQPGISSLDGGGERVDLDYNKKLPFHMLDLYQKSHFRRYEFANSVIIPDAVTGDFASGTGYGSVMLCEKSKKVSGVEINENVVEKIRIRYKNVDNVEFLNANLLDLEYECCFENIVSFETVEHLEEPDIRHLFNVFNRALKPGGKLIFSTPYMQEKSPEAHAIGFHKTYLIDEVRINEWLIANDFILESVKYQNYQTHHIVDQLDEKDFIICVARKI